MVQDNNYIGTVLTVVVVPGKIPQYEEWLKKIRAAMQAFPGFLGTDVVRPRDRKEPEYLLIQRFKTMEDQQRWTESKEREALLDEAREFVLHREMEIKELGIEMFFDRPSTRGSLPTPPLYKKIVVGVITVYPVILLTRYTISPLLVDFPVWLSILISVTFMSPLIGWLIPRVSKRLEGWLYPGP